MTMAATRNRFLVAANVEPFRKLNEDEASTTPAAVRVVDRRKWRRENPRDESVFIRAFLDLNGIA